MYLTLLAALTLAVPRAGLAWSWLEDLFKKSKDGTQTYLELKKSDVGLKVNGPINATGGIETSKLETNILQHDTETEESTVINECDATTGITFTNCAQLAGGVIETTTRTYDTNIFQPDTSGGEWCFYFSIDGIWTDSHVRGTTNTSFIESMCTDAVYRNGTKSYLFNQTGTGKGVGITTDPDEDYAWVDLNKRLYATKYYGSVWIYLSSSDNHDTSAFRLALGYSNDYYFIPTVTSDVINVSSWDKNTWHKIEFEFINTTPSNDNQFAVFGFISATDNQLKFYYDDVDLRRGHDGIDQEDANLYQAASGTSYLRIKRVVTTSESSTNPTFSASFDTSSIKDFSDKHFAFYLRPRKLDSTWEEGEFFYTNKLTFDLSTLEFNTFANVYFMTDSTHYEKNQLEWPALYTDWFRYPYSRYCRTAYYSNTGVDWSNINSIKFEFTSAETSFTSTNVNTTDDTITVPAYLKTGQKITLFSTSRSGATLPGGIDAGRTYWVIVTTGGVSSTTFKLATSAANCMSGTAVDLTSCDSCSGRIIANPDVMIDRVEAIKSNPAAFVIIRWNDNNRNTLTIGKPIQDQYGFPGTIAVPTVGDSKFAGLSGYAFGSESDATRNTLTLGEPIQDQYGFPGMMAVPTIGDSNFAELSGYAFGSESDTARNTPDQLLTAIKDGWEIVSHTHHHTDLGVISAVTPTVLNADHPSNVLANIVLPKHVLWYYGLGNGGQHLVVPYAKISHYGNFTMKEMKRHITLGLSDRPRGVVPLPLVNQWYVGTVNQNYTDVQPAIDFIAENGGLVQIIYHDITTGTPNITTIKDTVFAQTMAYIATKQAEARRNGRIFEVVTPSQLVKYLNIPAVDERQESQSKTRLVLRRWGSFTPNYPESISDIYLTTAYLSSGVETTTNTVMTLPLASNSWQYPFTVYVERIDSGKTVKVQPSTGNTINGSSSQITLAQGDRRRFVVTSDTNWKMISE